MIEIMFTLAVLSFVVAFAYIKKIQNDEDEDNNLFGC